METLTDVIGNATIAVAAFAVWCAMFVLVMVSPVLIMVVGSVFNG